MTEALARVLGAAVVAAVLSASIAAPARADDSAPVQDRATPEAAPRAGPTLVVVADIAGTETASAEVRAVLYEVARAHGYGPAGTLDVQGAAARESLIDAGTITDDPKRLQRLRSALGVGVVVRVSKSEDREGAAARLTIVTADGFQTRLLPSREKDVLRSGLDGLLPRQDGTARAAPPGEHTPPADPSERQLWEARTGFRPTYGAEVFASVTSLRHVGFTSANADGTGTVQGSGTATGVGGGIGARVGFIYLPTLQPNPTRGTFFTFRAGFGFDTDFLYVRTPKRYAYTDTSRSTVYGSQALWIASLPIEIGGAFATGAFGDSSWRGALIGIAYAPQGQFSMDLRGTTGTFRFNPAGAMLSVDLTSLDASRGDQSAPQIRLSLWGLAPLGDDRPWILSLGLGAIWY